MTSYELSYFKQLVRVWKTESLLPCLNRWTTNGVSKAKSCIFHFHKNDVTWPLSASGLLSRKNAWLPQFFFVDSNSPCKDLLLSCSPNLWRKNLCILVGSVLKCDEQTITVPSSFSLQRRTEKRLKSTLYYGRFRSVLVIFTNTKTFMEGERKYTRWTTKQDFPGELLHVSLTSLAFMQLVPGDDRAVHHICIWCLAYGWRAGNLNWPIRIQQAGKILVSWRQVQIRQLLSLEMALNIHEKGFPISKTKLVGKKWKIWTILCF